MPSSEPAARESQSAWQRWELAALAPADIAAKRLGLPCAVISTYTAMPMPSSFASPCSRRLACSASSPS